MKYKIFAEFEFEPLYDDTLIDEVAEILPTNATFTYEKLQEAEMDYEKALNEFTENYTKKVHDYINQQRPVWIDFIKFIEQRKPSDNSSSKKDLSNQQK